MDIKWCPCDSSDRDEVFLVTAEGINYDSLYAALKRDFSELENVSRKEVQIEE